MNAKIDAIQSGKPFGQVAQKFMAAGLSVDNMRPFVGEDGGSYATKIVGNDRKAINIPPQTIVGNATLRRDEWKDLDTAVLKAARERLVGTADLESRGLVRNITNGMGRTVLEYHDMNDPGEADIGMSPVAKGKNDAPDYSTNYLPLPIIYSDFTVDQRLLETSRNMGDSIDTTMAESAARRVSEKLEALFFTDTSYAFGGGTIYSYISHPDVNSVSLSTNWDASDGAGSAILDDVRQMKAAAITAKKFGPYMLYIPTDYEVMMDMDYSSQYPKTIKQRILEISNIIDVKVVDTLPGDTVLLVEMTSETVRLVNGLGIKVIQWNTQGGMLHHFKVLTIQVPQIRSDQDGNNGIVKLA